MIGRIISALAGRAAARSVGGMTAGPLGTVVGAALPTVMRRVGPAGMIGIAAGGYLLKRMADKRRLQGGQTIPGSALDRR